MPEAFERLYGDLILELSDYLATGDILACRLVSKATKDCFGLPFQRLFTHSTLDLTPSENLPMRTWNNKWMSRTREAYSPAQRSWLSDMLAEQDASAECAGVAMRDALSGILQALSNGLKTLSLELLIVRHMTSHVSPKDFGMLHPGAF
ncbi:hypothetical protein PspLS_08223 [Pyricularia sp. CBS 133598]|nr:hypothetical protein PspLS_08223 [Pyricularia sp. CBS 133598]